ncbi:MAG: hypothetical protein IPG87_02705 [Saprospiraceae bacterium]|nr:hypothetical protein [Candidatus Vicinibacter affinis]
MITNVTADHLGLSDVHTLDELAKVKGLVVDAVKPGGWAVLNAENEYTYHIGQQSKNEVAYFSLDKNNPALTEHLGKGKTAAYVEDGLIKIMKNTEAVSIIHVKTFRLHLGEGWIHGGQCACCQSRMLRSRIYKRSDRIRSENFSCFRRTNTGKT